MHNAFSCSVLAEYRATQLLYCSIINSQFFGDYQLSIVGVAYKHDLTPLSYLNTAAKLVVR